MENTLEQILGELKTNKIELNNIRADLKNSIKASEDNILLKIEELKHKVDQLEEENAALRERNEFLERNSRRNNIVVFGLGGQSVDLTVDHIRDRLCDLVGIEIQRVDINNFYRLGKNLNSPIKIEFTSYLKKKELISNCKKLKGTEVKILQDLTERQRKDYRILKQNLVQERQKNKNCFIRGNKLVVNNCEYTSSDLREGKLEKEQKRTSLPSNPTQGCSIQSEGSGEKSPIVLQIPRTQVLTGVTESISPISEAQQQTIIPGKDTGERERPTKSSRAAVNQKVTRSKTNSSRAD